MKTITEKKAIAIKNKVITCLVSQKKDLRYILTVAKYTKSYLLEPDLYSDFAGFTRYCIAEAQSDIAEDYARKQANAGMVELVLFGPKGIGTLPEGALRPLVQNVKEKNRKKVFLHASKGLPDNKYPTAKMLINSAKELNFYIQNGTKEIEQLKLVASKPINKVKDTPIPQQQNAIDTGVNKKRSVVEQVKQSNVVPLFYTVDDVKSEPKQAPVTSLSSDKASKNIIDKYSSSEIKLIISYLRVYQDDGIKNECTNLIKKCSEKAVNNIIKKLSIHLKSVAKNKPATEKNVGHVPKRDTK